MSFTRPKRSHRDRERSRDYHSRKRDRNSFESRDNYRRDDRYDDEDPGLEKRI